MITLLLNHIEAKKDMYTKIMINNKNSITIDILYDAIHNDLTKQIAEKTELSSNNIPSSIISKFYLGAVFNVCMEWLKTNNTYSKEEIIHYIDLLIPDNILKSIPSKDTFYIIVVYHT